MLRWFKKKSDLERLRPTKKVKLDGILFEFKKIDIVNYLEGSQTLLKTYDIYQTAKEKDVVLSQSAINKIKKHYIDVFMGAVLKPSLSRKENCGEKIHVEEIFNDWELANELYEEIISFTYGKKKLK